MTTAVVAIAGKSLYALERDFRRLVIRTALEAAGGNRSRAAAALECERSGLQRMMKTLGLQDYAAKVGRPLGEDLDLPP